MWKLYCSSERKILLVPWISLGSLVESQIIEKEAQTIVAASCQANLVPPLECNAAIIRNAGAGAASVADVGRKKMDEGVDF